MNNYSVKVDGLRVRSSAAINPANILDSLKQGQKVLVLERNDPWFRVQYGNKSGWVHSDYLAPVSVTTSQSVPSVANQSIAGELPVFVVGIANLTSDPNTSKLRKIIADVFGNGRGGYPLQCTEYVQYKIAQDGITIRWPADRPRDGGKWAGIFERNKMYKVLTDPKAKCAISFTAGLGPVADKTGHIAYVEEVFSDGSIRITEANWPGQGKYNDRKLTKSQWQDKHKCRFVDFS